MANIAQQNASGDIHFYVYTDDGAGPTGANMSTRVCDFDACLLNNRMLDVFGV